MLAETEDVWNGIFEAEGMNYQEPTLVPNMSIAANVFLNRERLKGGMLLSCA